MKDFGNTKGAGSSFQKPYTMQTGINKFRIIPGTLLPYYSYWVEHPTERADTGQLKQAPFEDLQFNRDTEEFDTSKPCPVKEAGVTGKTSKGDAKRRGKWGYKCLVLDDNNKVLPYTWTVKLFDQVSTLAKDMKYNITDIDEGTWLTVERVQGSKGKFDVSYNLKSHLAVSEPLTDEQKEIIAASKSITEMYPVETYEEQKERLDKFLNGTKETAAEPSSNDEVPSDL